MPARASRACGLAGASIKSATRTARLWTTTRLRIGCGGIRPVRARRAAGHAFQRRLGRAFSVNRAGEDLELDGPLAGRAFLAARLAAEVAALGAGGRCRIGRPDKLAAVPLWQIWPIPIALISALPTADSDFGSIELTIGFDHGVVAGSGVIVALGNDPEQRTPNTLPTGERMVGPSNSLTQVVGLLCKIC
jgi:hypothetical protein